MVVLGESLVLEIFYGYKMFFENFSGLILVRCILCVDMIIGGVVVKGLVEVVLCGKVEFF